MSQRIIRLVDEDLFGAAQILKQLFAQIPHPLSKLSQHALRVLFVLLDERMHGGPVAPVIQKVFIARSDRHFDIVGRINTLESLLKKFAKGFRLNNAPAEQSERFSPEMPLRQAKFAISAQAFKFRNKVFHAGTGAMRHRLWKHFPCFSGVSEASRPVMLTFSRVAPLNCRTTGSFGISASKVPQRCNASS